MQYRNSPTRIQDNQILQYVFFHLFNATIKIRKLFNWTGLGNWYLLSSVVYGSCCAENKIKHFWLCHDLKQQLVSGTLLS